MKKRTARIGFDAQAWQISRGFKKAPPAPAVSVTASEAGPAPAAHVVIPKAKGKKHG